MNDKGKWFVTTPGSVQVRRSNEDLIVECRKEGIDPGRTSVQSTVKGGMFGNIIFGGFIGAAVDHSTGAAYEYPTLIQVLMGAQTTISAAPQADAEKPNTAPATQISTTAAPSAAPRTNAASISLEAAKDRCIEMGLKPQTESFGQCVMKLAQ